MKCIVIAQFIDKTTGNTRSTGEVMDLAEDRFDRLCDAGVVEPAPDQAEAEKGAEAKPKAPTVRELKAMLEGKGIAIPSGANKADLEKLLAGSDSTSSTTEDDCEGSAEDSTSSTTEDDCEGSAEDSTSSTTENSVDLGPDEPEDEK